MRSARSDVCHLIRRSRSPDRHHRSKSHSPNRAISIKSKVLSNEHHASRSKSLKVEDATHNEKENTSQTKIEVKESDKSKTRVKSRKNKKGKNKKCDGPKTSDDEEEADNSKKKKIHLKNKGMLPSPDERKKSYFNYSSRKKSIDSSADTEASSSSFSSASTSSTSSTPGSDKKKQKNKTKDKQRGKVLKVSLISSKQSISSEDEKISGTQTFLSRTDPRAMSPSRPLSSLDTYRKNASEIDELFDSISIDSRSSYRDTQRKTTNRLYKVSLKMVYLYLRSIIAFWYF